MHAFVVSTTLPPHRQPLFLMPGSATTASACPSRGRWWGNIFWQPLLLTRRCATLLLFMVTITESDRKDKVGLFVQPGRVPLQYFS